MTNQTYQEIQELRNEIRQYRLLKITALEMGELVKYNPKPRRKFISQLRFALERLVTENPQLGKQIPVEIKSQELIQILVQSQ